MPNTESISEKKTMETRIFELADNMELQKKNQQQIQKQIYI